MRGLSSVTVAICVYAILLLTGCSNSKEIVYSGQLEATTVRILAPTAGTIRTFPQQEGDKVVTGSLIAQIDIEKLQAQLQQNNASGQEIDSNKAVLTEQSNQLNIQLEQTNRQLERSKILERTGAISSQNMEDMESKVALLQSQLVQVTKQKRALEDKAKQLTSLAKVISLQINDAQVLSPISGVVLSTYAEAGEQTAPGALLAEVANLEEMTVRIYLPLEKLAKVKLGQTVSVRLDGVAKSIPGIVSTIASNAEFTPKTIMTPETRRNLVYAVKIKVSNVDGVLKIGLPVGVTLSS